MLLVFFLLPHMEPTMFNKATAVLKALLVVTGCAFAVGAGAAGSRSHRAGFRGVGGTMTAGKWRQADCSKQAAAAPMHWKNYE